MAPVFRRDIEVFVCAFVVGAQIVAIFSIRDVLKVSIDNYCPVIIVSMLRSGGLILISQYYSPSPSACGLWGYLPWVCVVFG